MNELLLLLMFLIFVATALQAVLERIVARERARAALAPGAPSAPGVVHRGPSRVEGERAVVERIERARAIAEELSKRARAEPQRGSLEQLGVRRETPSVAERPAEARPPSKRAPPAALPRARARRDWLRRAVVMREILGPPRALCASASDPVPR